MSSGDRVRKHRAPEREKKMRNIGVIDMETDPFDNLSQADVFPFVVEVYAREFDPIVIWDDNFDSLIARLIAALDAIEQPYTFYAHNGGKFDFMFLVHELRGAVSFKGRGIMDAKLGKHTLRDSFHIIPEKLASYAKEKFDYLKNRRGQRQAHKAEILEYLHSDCVYLYDIVSTFIAEFGLKLSIGQAAMAELKKHYTWEKFSPGWDEFMRQYFFGGRVECLAGLGDFRGDYQLVDVNSMYPDVMAHCSHPVGGFHDYAMRAGDPDENTVFVDLNCANRGALIARNENMETTAGIKRGRFRTTIWEYRTALKHDLISDVEINFCVDCPVRTDFSKFVLPLYQRRQLTKRMLGDMKKAGEEGTPRYLDIKKDDIFLKLLLNNAYGKFAQNPRRFKEHYLTDPDETPPAEWMASIEELPRKEREKYLLPAFESGRYWIWMKPAPGFRFNNVGTAASITGAARAKLLDALCTVDGAIYCDTDSIICRDASGLWIDKEALGAWDIEAEYSRVIINGKKLYSTVPRGTLYDADGQPAAFKVKSKGTAGLSWADMERLLGGETIPVVSSGPTLTKFGDQSYITRRISATAKPMGH